VSREPYIRFKCASLASPGRTFPGLVTGTAAINSLDFPTLNHHYSTTKAPESDTGALE